MLATLIAALIASQALPTRTPPGIPKDVSLFAERVEMCGHWSGEAPYDPARERQIESSLHALRCATAGRDGAALRRRHARNPQALRVLDALARDGAE